jgi:hypothetical protein
MRSDRKLGLGDGACAQSRAGTVTDSVRRRSGYRNVGRKKSVAGQFAFKTTSSIGQKHLAGQKTKQERLLVILSELK